MKRPILILLLLAPALFGGKITAQCLGSQYDFRTCEGDTINVSLPPCTGCTYTWSPAPLFPSTSNSAKYTTVDGPIAANATASLQLSVSVNDPINACQYSENVQIWVSHVQDIFIEDLNGTWIGDTSQIYRYALHHYFDVPGMYEQNLTWFTNDGTILGSVSSALNPFSFPFASRTDTVSVKWNQPNSPKLGVSMSTLDGTGGVLPAQSCLDTGYLDLGSPLPPIFGPAFSCTADTVGYTTTYVPVSNFHWTVTGGSILMGQGTDSIAVAWSGSLSSGTVEVRRIIGVDTSYSAPFGVSPYQYPTGFLGNDTSFCSGSGVVLDASGAQGQLYSWSTGSTAQTITATSPGIYSVEVLDLFCNVNSYDTVLVTSNPSPSPNLGPDTDLCPGDSILVNAGGGYTSYLWSNNANTQSQYGFGPGFLWVEVTDNNGCTGRDTIQIGNFPAAFVDLGPDTSICADTSVVLDPGPSFNTYLWNTAAVTQTIQVSQPSLYIVSVTDFNGCTDMDSILVSLIPDCVFPGDADYDGIADNNDVLAIGVAYGSTGPLRSNSSLNWHGQGASDWFASLPLPSTANYKQIDTNGDGLVNDNDTLAISQNYGLSHNKNALVQTGGLVLQITADFDSIDAGDTAVYEISLGSIANPADSVYGLAFRINYDTSIADTQGLLFVDYNNCWFAPAGNRLSFTKDLYPAPMAEVALVRQSGPDTSGYGRVCRLGIVTIENISGKKSILAKTLALSLTDITLINREMIQLSVGGSVDSTVIVANELAAGGGQAPEKLVVYPVPAYKEAYLTWKGHAIQVVEVHDLNGKVLETIACDGKEREKIEVEDWPEGIYILRVSGNGVSTTVKFPVLR